MHEFWHWWLVNDSVEVIQFIMTCPGFRGDNDFHPCECGDHAHCNPGMTPEEAMKVASWPEDCDDTA